MISEFYLVFILSVLNFLSSEALNPPPYEITWSKAEVYSLPKLQYEYNELEPHLDEATLQAHHGGHHETYRKKMNSALQEWRRYDFHDKLATQPVLRILQNLDKVPDQFRKAIRNNAGGYVNHAIYWACMSPNHEKNDRVPKGHLMNDIEYFFGSFDNFKGQFTAEALSLFGSGYVWLNRREDGSLEISSTANQDSPISEGLKPILVLDVWEHAYYLKNQFRRPQYVADWWHIVDWNNVEALDKWWKHIEQEPKDEL